MSPALALSLIGAFLVAFILWLVTTSASRALALRRVRKIAIARGDRIGLFVDCGDSPTHTHYGTWSFTNFTKVYGYDWKLKSELIKVSAGHFFEAGLSVVDLQAEGFQAAELAGLIRLRFWNWQVRDDAILRRLQDQLGLKGLLVIKEGRVTALSEGGGENDAGFVGYAEATGLFTRAVFWWVRHFAVAAYRWNLYWLDPPADLALAYPLRSMLDVPSIWLQTFASPVDFSNLTEHELEPVRRQVLIIISQTASTAVRCLKSRAGI